MSAKAALSLLSVLPALVFVSQASASPVSVNVDLSSAAMTSQLAPGVSLVDSSLYSPWGGNDPAAVGTAMSTVAASTSFVNVPIMAWGTADPWPDPSTPGPTNWGTLDAKVQMAIASGHTPVITLAEAPWWMKGQLQSDGTTKLIPDASGEYGSHTYSSAVTDYRGITYPAGYVSPDPYASRILDDEMNNWVTLVKAVAQRYMAPPFNVRYFQVWNEMKGYYDPTTNAYDYTTSPGDPSGNNAQSGYTYMYNQVYTGLMQQASSLGIPTSAVQVGGPYVVMQTWSDPSTESNPSTLTKAYGNYDERPLDVIKYWLQHKIGAGFITVDGGNDNSDNVNTADDFTASQKFGDVVSWIRSLDPSQYPGSTTLPVWWAEWYATPHSIAGATEATDAAVKSYAMAYLLQHGGAVPLAWGEQGDWNQDGGAGGSLYTDTTQAGGGQPLPWASDYQAFKDDFGPGTKIYDASVSDSTSLGVLASSSHTMLINKTGGTMTVDLGGTAETLAPYQVSVFPTPQGAGTGVLPPTTTTPTTTTPTTPAPPAATTPTATTAPPTTPAPPTATTPTTTTPTTPAPPAATTPTGTTPPTTAPPPPRRKRRHPSPAPSPTGKATRRTATRHRISHPSRRARAHRSHLLLKFSVNPVHL